MNAAAAAGWYGKLAMLGDFASRRLDASWVRACDQWLSEGLRASQFELGDAWLSHYLAAPVWRFACAPGVWDTRWWFGLLMPSCDSVGRYYPLVLAQPREHPPADRIALNHLELWWGHLARCGLATLADGASLQAFEDDLHQCPPWPGASAALRAQVQPLQGRTRHVFKTSATAFDVALALALPGALHGLQGCSLWWPVRAEAAAGGVPVSGQGLQSCTLCPGMPPAQAFSALLQGQW